MKARLMGMSGENAVPLPPRGAAAAAAEALITLPDRWPPSFAVLTPLLRYVWRRPRCRAAPAAWQRLPRRAAPLRWLWPWARDICWLGGARAPGTVSTASFRSRPSLSQVPRACAYPRSRTEIAKSKSIALAAAAPARRRQTHPAAACTSPFSPPDSLPALAASRAIESQEEHPLVADPLAEAMAGSAAVASSRRRAQASRTRSRRRRSPSMAAAVPSR